MENVFFLERGKYLFEEGETDPFSIEGRSRSVEHSSDERSKSSFSDETENSQKSEKIEENES